MTDPDQTDDLDPLAVDLVGFIKEYSTLLVVMGVFAAIAVYISQSAPELGTSTDSQLMYATGFVSALGMTLLFLLLMYNELAGEVGSWSKLHLAHYRLNNLPLALFTLFNGMLALSILYLITQFEPAIFILVIVATVFVGGGLVLRSLHFVGELVPRSPWVRIPALFIVSAVTVFASNFALEEYYPGVNISTIHELTLTEPVPIAIAVVYILLGTIRAAGAIGVFAAFLSIPIVAFDKLRGKSPYDNPE